MASLHTIDTLALQPSPPHAALAGCWKLEAGRATTLRPHQSGVFRVTQGAVWVTFDGPHHGPGNDRGDQVVLAGEAIALRPGQRAVVEPWFIGAVGQASPPAYFRWEPVRQRAESPAVAAPAHAEASAQWHAGVVQPVRELGLALGLVAGALGRFALGMGRWLGLLATGRRAGPAVVHLH
jgi:hypothetical protein